MPEASEKVVNPMRIAEGAERGKPWYDRTDRGKPALLHESRGAREKLPGHRKPSVTAFDKLKTRLRPGGKVPGRPSPKPPTSYPPYAAHFHGKPPPWFDPGKEPVIYDPGKEPAI